MIKYEPVQIDDRLTQHTYDNYRVYTDSDNNSYYSVTTVLSILSEDSIRAWRARVGEEEANRISKQASTRGSKVHDMIEQYIIGEDVDYSDLISKMNFVDIKPIIDFGIIMIIALLIVSINSLSQLSLCSTKT